MQLSLIAIVLLVGIITVLMIYNISIHNKIKEFTNIDQQINNINILQSFMNTLSEASSANDKLKRINEIVIEKYDIKYSTIVIFNGAEYVVKSSNVDEKHWEALKGLHKEPIFKQSIDTATAKYVTINRDGERLPYQKMEFARAKSAMFFPLYNDNVYIGYWLIEGTMPHEFDNIDTTILEIVKINIVTVLKTLQNQSVIENIVRDDLYSGLKSAEYLYGDGKRVIDKYMSSTVCLFRITNIVEINEKLGRKAGDKLITLISNNVKKELAEEYIFVRYMGPKFAIVFSGVERTGVETFLKTLKENLEKIEVSSEIYVDDDDNYIESMNPTLDFALTTYYKGTQLDGTTKKLEEFLDQEPVNSSNINYM